MCWFLRRSIGDFFNMNLKHKIMKDLIKQFIRNSQTASNAIKKMHQLSGFIDYIYSYLIKNGPDSRIVNN